MNLDSLLRAMVAKRASDLHLKVGCYPHIRLSGQLVPLADFGKLAERKKETNASTLKAAFCFDLNGLIYSTLLCTIPRLV